MEGASAVVNVVLGTLLTVVGLITGNPYLITAGLALVASGVMAMLMEPPEFGEIKKIEGMFSGKTFASNEFTIKNFNKDSLLKDTPIEGTVNLESLKSKQFNVIIIDGNLIAKSLPEQVAIKIFNEEKSVNSVSSSLNTFVM